MPVFYDISVSVPSWLVRPFALYMQASVCFSSSPFFLCLLGHSAVSFQTLCRWSGVLPWLSHLLSSSLFLSFFQIFIPMLSAQKRISVTPWGLCICRKTQIQSQSLTVTDSGFPSPDATETHHQHNTILLGKEIKMHSF